MAVLSAADRKNMSDDEFALSGHRFPLNDKAHDRLAISGATRAEHAGNISESQEEHVKAEARAKLGEKGGDASKDHRQAVSKMHPEHVHKLVQAAAEGKFGDQAKLHAQRALEPTTDGQIAEADNRSKPARAQSSARQVFGAGQDVDDAPNSASEIFSGRPGR